VLHMLKQRACEALSTAQRVILSADGPAGIQAEALICEAVGLVLYVLVPRTSDLLFNLESNALVVATADAWQVRGMARVLAPGVYPNQLAIARTPAAVWSEVIEIQPTRLQLRPPSGQDQEETIDIC
jgi:hypothetical protein